MRLGSLSGTSQMLAFDRDQASQVKQVRPADRCLLALQEGVINTIPTASFGSSALDLSPLKGTWLS